MWLSSCRTSALYITQTQCCCKMTFDTLQYNLIMNSCINACVTINSSAYSASMCIVLSGNKSQCSTVKCVNSRIVFAKSHFCAHIIQTSWMTQTKWMKENPVFSQLHFTFPSDAVCFSLILVRKSLFSVFSAEPAHLRSITLSTSARKSF